MQTEINKVVISAGLLIIQDNKILLEHPTNHRWHDSYSIPKGELKEGEDIFECALRETQEELGILLDRNKLISSGPEFISYVKDVIGEYKRVYYFVCHYPEVIEIDMTKLQLEEVDWAGFLTKEEAESRIFWRQKDVLKYLK